MFTFNFYTGNQHLSTVSITISIHCSTFTDRQQQVGIPRMKFQFIHCISVAYKVLKQSYRVARILNCPPVYKQDKPWDFLELNQTLRPHIKGNTHYIDHYPRTKSNLTNHNFNPAWF